MATALNQINQAWLNNQMNSQMANQAGSMLNMAGAGYSANTVTIPWANSGVFAGPPIHYRKQSLFMKRLEGITGQFNDAVTNIGINNYFRDQTVSRLLPAMEFNPMYRGRPRKEVNWLLLAGPSPIKLFYQHRLFYAGLVTLEPAVANRRKARCRLSYAGLELLDHWAIRYPKFKPFVDAYLTKKARQEIASDALGYRLGFMPERFKAMQELNEKELAKNRDTPNRRRYAAKMKKQQEMYLAQQAYQPSLDQPQWTSAIFSTTDNTVPTAIGTSTTPVTARDNLGLGSMIGSGISKLLGRG